MKDSDMFFYVGNRLFSTKTGFLQKSKKNEKEC